MRWQATIANNMSNSQQYWWSTRLWIGNDNQQHPENGLPQRNGTSNPFSQKSTLTRGFVWVRLIGTACIPASTVLHELPRLPGVCFLGKAEKGCWLLVCWIVIWYSEDWEIEPENGTMEDTCFQQTNLFAAPSSFLRFKESWKYEPPWVWRTLVILHVRWWAD